MVSFNVETGLGQQKPVTAATNPIQSPQTREKQGFGIAPAQFQRWNWGDHAELGCVQNKPRATSSMAAERHSLEN